MEVGVRRKAEAFKDRIFDDVKADREASDGPLLDTGNIITLLSGGKVKPSELYKNRLYAEIDSVSLVMNDDDFARIVSELGDDGEILLRLREVVNCAQLISAMKGASCISEGKVRIYVQHRNDLKCLKYFVKKYCPEKYDEIFRDAVADNYACYSKNVKSVPEDRVKKIKFADKDAFCAFIKKCVKDINAEESDRAEYEDMLLRLDARTFLPKQRDVDNRIIPQQLYRYEMERILDNAREYLPMLGRETDDGVTVLEKILSVFAFRIPYFVGPLKDNGGKNTWLKRKAQGKILPWNFDAMVDLDASEQEFIKRMTNMCTYLPWETVMSENSLLYERFKVLNELNCLKINGCKIPVSVKHELYTGLFEKRDRVTVNRIREYLIQHGYMEKCDEKGKTSFLYLSKRFAEILPYKR